MAPMFGMAPYGMGMPPGGGMMMPNAGMMPAMYAVPSVYNMQHVNISFYRIDNFALTIARL